MVEVPLLKLWCGVKHYDTWIYGVKHYESKQSTL